MGTWTKGFKAFDPGMTCRGKQYAENSEYEEPEAEMCRCGMHFCQDPWDVTDYYDLVDDDGHVPEFAEVEGEDVETEDDKSVTRHLRIGARLSLGGWIKACFDFLFERTDTDDRGQSSDDRYAQLASSGDSARLASSGDSARLASSGDSAQLASSGDSAQLASSGDSARLASSGENSIVCAIGRGSMAKASVGSWITLAEFDERGVVKLVKTEQVDRERIKADTWYVIVDGEFKEVRE